MADTNRCGICRRSSFMEDNGEKIPDGGMCSDCETAYSTWRASGANATLSNLDSGMSVLWGARRALEFADAITDATSFSHRPGDPGHSRTPSRVRRRR